MGYNTEDIIKLLVKGNYLSTLEGKLLTRQKNNLKVNETPIAVLKENLTISLKSGKLTPRNIRDFNSLLRALEKVKDDCVLSIDITDNKKHRTIYIDCSITTVLDEI